MNVAYDGAQLHRFLPRTATDRARWSAASTLW